MKFTKLALAACLVTVLSIYTGSAQAALINSAPVDGLATFKDTSTGLVWLQLPDLFNQDYSSQLASAAAAGFTVADFAHVNALGMGSADLSLGQWSAVEAIIGGSSSRGLMWGNYSDSSGNGWYYAYSGDTRWSYYDPNDQTSYSDLGLWAYQTGTSSVPEPASMAMFVGGLAGIGALRRRRRS